MQSINLSYDLKVDGTYMLHTGVNMVTQFIQEFGSDEAIIYPKPKILSSNIEENRKKIYTTLLPVPEKLGWSYPP